MKVALVGIGNCASSLIQGIHHYSITGCRSGLMHLEVGPYHVRDIEVVTGFDVDERKVGKDISEAIFAPPNCTPKFCDVPVAHAPVYKGPVLDGVGSSLRQKVRVSEEQEPVDVAQVLQEKEAEIVVNFLPTGSRKATEFYAQASISAGCAFINCIPELIASSAHWQDKFRKAGLPLLGDDVKSQIGASILHRALLQLCKDRGIEIADTYQFNFGGNTDFLNMQDRMRYESKHHTKEDTIRSLLGDQTPVTIIPTGYAEFLNDNKIAYISLEGTLFGGLPFSIDVKLSVIDSPNSAGIVIDTIRLAKIALDRGIGGPLVEVSSYLFKKPPQQLPDSVGKERIEEFIRGI